MNTRPTPVFTLLTVAALTTSASCFAAEKFTFLTNWYAQAEHGGFYQAQATGLYQHAGLDVEIKMGGPQINVSAVDGGRSGRLYPWRQRSGAGDLAGRGACGDCRHRVPAPRRRCLSLITKWRNPAELKDKTFLLATEAYTSSGRGRRASWVWLAAKCAPIPLTSSRSSPIKTLCSRAT